MQMTPWEEIVVDLFSEVSILEPLINQQIERDKPEGFGEVAMAILITLSRLGDVGIARGALIWELEDSNDATAAEIDALIARGLIVVSPADQPERQKLVLSNDGRLAMAAAVRALLPRFKPALEGLSIEAMIQATETLREIRRTLDNLPD
jgi:DNA-binding MarR family transcriptional regulator